MSGRIDRLRAVASSQGADAVLVTHPTNRRYFTGFPAADHAPDESYGVLVVTADAATLYTSTTNLPWAEHSVRAPVSAAVWERPWQSFLGEKLREMGSSRVLFEDRALSVADHATMVAAASGIPFIPAGESIHALRAIKDQDELASLAAAARITDAALAAATEGLRPGTTEKEMVRRIENAMLDLGADAPGFPTIVAAGPHGARPHHDPSDRPIQTGEPVVIDMGAAVNGYSADLTRTIWLGDPPPEYISRYNTVLAAQIAALHGIRPGMTGREADAIARDALVAAGMSELLLHGLGHGVGLNIHEYPSLGTNSDDVLQPGHVVTIEPGIYSADWGGIRIEDLGVVTETGLDVLSAAPK